MVNTAPIISGLDSGNIYGEDSPAILLDLDIDLQDSELEALNAGAGNYDGATLIIQRQGGANALDEFGFDPTALAAAGITITGIPPVMSPDIATTTDGLAFGAGGRMMIAFHSGAT